MLGKVYFDHLCSAPRNTSDPNFLNSFTVWANKAEDYNADLLGAMGKCLGYDFGKVELKKHFYAPQAFADLEWAQAQIRNLTLELLSGKRSLPVEIIMPAKTPDRTNERKPAETPDGTDESKKTSSR